MKKAMFAFLFGIFFLSKSFSQTALTASTGRMGPFKLEMIKKDVEKIISKKIDVVFGKEISQTEVKVNYNGIDFALTFAASYGPENNNDSARIFSIKTTDKRIKTLSGLGVGNTKNDLLNVYSDKYNINIFSPFEENKTTGQWEKTPGKRTLAISDTETVGQLSFTMIDGIVVEIELLEAEED